MKAVKYLVAGLLMMGLSAPAMAQEVNYKDMLKPIETTLKAGDATSKEFEKEIKEYQKVFKKDPKALVALGNALVINKQYDKANAVADAIIAKFKNYGDAYILKGDIYAMQDNGGEAATWYGQCMTMDPKNPQGYISYANVYRKIDPAASADALSKLREVDPNYPIEAETGHNYYSIGNYDKAYENFSKAKHETMEEYIFYEYCFTAYVLNKKDEALTLCKEGMQKYPKDTAFQILAMRSAVDTQNFEEALQYANAIMSNNDVKKNSSIYSYYGLALAGNKQYDQAIEQYNKALETNKDDVKPYQYLAEVYKSMGNEDKALEYSQTYMDKNPNAAPSDFVKMAEIYNAKAQKGGPSKGANVDKAISVYNSFAAKYPQLKSYADLQAANIAFQNEMDDKALENYEKVINEVENKQYDEDEKGYLMQAYKNAGYIYWSSKNNLEAAKPYFEKLLKLDPNNALAKKALGLEEEK
ncbi:MAG TPA: hypothetical protein DDW28_02945 [Prevotella sp.]|nr:hypothetical protein [Candidatus Segatella violae]